MVRYLLDTDHVREVWWNNIPMRQRIDLDADSDFGIAMPTFGEIWFLGFNSSKRKKNIRTLRHTVRRFAFWDFDSRAAMEYGLIRTELLQRGKAISVIAMQVAAIARKNGLIVVSADPDFSHVADLRTVSWM